MIALMLLGCRSDPPPLIEPWTPPPPVCVETPVAAAVSMSDNPLMVLEKRFAVDVPGEVILRCTSPDDPLEDHVLTGTGELRLYGVLPETRYDCVVTDLCDAVLWTGTFTTAALPDGFPDLVVSGDPVEATIDEDYVLFSHWVIGAGPKTHRLVVIDGAGRIRWYQDFPEAVTGGIAASWLGDGRMVLGGGGVTPALRDLSGDVLFEVGPPREPNPDDDIYNHEALLTSSGLLSLQRYIDTDGIAEWDGFLIEVTDIDTAEVVWSYDSLDARLAGLLPPGTVDLDDPYHANAVAWRDDDPDGPSVWVCLKALETLMRIDRTTGEVTMIGHDRGIALVDVAGDPLPDEQWFWGQHAPWYEGDEILVYDNGNARRGGDFSRVAQYRRDGPDQMTLLWEWSEPAWFEPNFGSAVPLPGGHVLVATGHCSHCPGTGGQDDTGWILELAPDTGTVVWRFDLPAWGDSTYRAEAIDGCDLFANVRFCSET